MYDDVLDAIGRPPQEMGGLQVHVEPVVRGADGRAVAQIWLQAAFAPAAAGTLHVAALEGSTERPLTVDPLPLPATPDGAVVHWCVPFELSEATAHLLFRFDAPVAASAERVRTAWKVSDTLEMTRQTKASGNRGIGASAGRSVLVVGAGLLAGPVGALAARYLTREAGGAAGDEDIHLTRHAAEALAPEWRVPVVQGQPQPLGKAAVCIVWSPGRPLPQVRPLVTVANQACAACGAALRPNAEFCSHCLAAVAAGTTHAPMPAPVSETSSGAQQALTDTAAGARCVAHPDRSAHATCSRCGAFCCDACIPDSTAQATALCMACEAGRAIREAPSQLRRAALFAGIALFANSIILSVPVLAGAPRYGSNYVTMVLGVVVLGLPGILAGLVVLATRAVWSLWVAFGLQLLMTLAAFALSDGLDGGMLVELGCAVVLLLCALQGRTLRSRIRAAA